MSKFYISFHETQFTKLQITLAKERSLMCIISLLVILMYLQENRLLSVSVVTISLYGHFKI